MAVKKVAPSGVRTIVAFPNIQDFYNLLYDRLYMVVREFFLEKKELPFTLIINALPRDHQANTLIQIDRATQPLLKYVGLEKQRELFGENTKVIKPNSKSDPLQGWAYLADHYLTEGQATNELYDAVQRGDVSISNIHPGRIEEYFNNPVLKTNPFTVAEKKILTYFLDWTHYNYASVPLIQFGELDGIVHIIYHEEENTVFFDQDKNPHFVVFKRLINAIRVEYEGLMLDWEVEGKYYNFKQTALRRVIDPNYDKELYKRLEELPILRELEVQPYYKRHADYFKYRFKLADMIPDVLEEQYRRTANLSAIVDSFAHNITAHSMTAVERQLRRIDGNLPLENYSIPNVMLRMLRPYQKYILEKGAFWTGALRGESYGGTVDDLYSVLWDGFVNNPLFLGSVVRSEGVTKVNIKISFLHHVEHHAGIQFKKKVLYTGSLCSVDISELYNAILSKKERLYSPIVSQVDQEVVTRLKNVQVFFPGAVVGHHALYTILENELRNIKHYDKEVIDRMQEKGLTLHLSIEEDSISKKAGSLDYYKLGIWLEHPTMLSQKHLINRLTRLDEDIIDPNAMNRPRLGGTSQDKICAAFLFNNNFNSKDVGAEKRAKRFYPWVKIGSSEILEDKETSDLEEEYCLSARRILHSGYEDAKEYFQLNYKTGLGVYKKFIHLWKGADVHQLPKADNIDSEIDNPSRFRFITIDDAPAITFQLLRERGFFRILRQQVESIEEAYPLWLKNWLGADEQELRLNVNDDWLGSIALSGGKVQFKARERVQLPHLKTSLFLEVFISHSVNGEQQEYLHYRNHGAFVQKFCTQAIKWDASNKKLVTQLGNLKYIPEALAAKLMETFMTKIIIIDDRVADRLADRKLVYEKYLKLNAYGESLQNWDQVKPLLLQSNILVLHLSFIEKFKDKEGNKLYSEMDIREFIENEILNGVPPKDNFILVITTGRGRTEWLESMKTEKQRRDYTNFVMLRPIESLLAAIEDGLSIGDDIEVKYRLVKILMGS
jgi:hypothetical protein